MTTTELQKPIEIDEDCQFMADLVTIENGNRNYNLGMWNLICSIRDLKLFCKGIKPHKKWRLKDARFYMGLFDTTKKEDVLSALHLMRNSLKRKA